MQGGCRVVQACGGVLSRSRALKDPSSADKSPPNTRPSWMAPRVCNGVRLPTKSCRNKWLMPVPAPVNPSDGYLLPPGCNLDVAMEVVRLQEHLRGGARAHHALELIHGGESAAPASATTVSVEREPMNALRAEPSYTAARTRASLLRTLAQPSSPR